MYNTSENVDPLSTLYGPARTAWRKPYCNPELRRFELKIGNPENVHTNFGFSMPSCFRTTQTADRQTDRQEPQDP